MASTADQQLIYQSAKAEIYGFPQKRVILAQWYGDNDLESFQATHLEMTRAVLRDGYRIMFSDIRKVHLVSGQLMSNANIDSLVNFLNAGIKHAVIIENEGIKSNKAHNLFLEIVKPYITFEHVQDMPAAWVAAERYTTRMRNQQTA